jgi:hypothetical protein
MRRLLVAVLLSIPLLAQSPDEWDIERRLAERFDETRNAERTAALVTRFPNLAFKPEKNAPGSRYYVIEGERNPELFLPHELFEGLIDKLDPGKTPPDVYGTNLGDLGFDAASFWTKLEQLSAGYRAVKYKYKTAEERVARCRALTDALDEARAAFGKKEFDTLLYKAVAPATRLTTATTEPNPVARLRREARGCRLEPDPPGRQVWDWTIGERVAARLVAADRKRRVERWVAATGAKSKPYDYLEGRTHPELLLPTEVVDVFIDAVLAPEDESTAPARAAAANHAVEMGLPTEFFPALEKAFAPAVAAHREHVRYMRTLKVGQVVGQDVATRVQRLQRDTCRARWKGIQTLRAAYGKSFDRFLYEVVAPNVRKMVHQPVTADELRAVERGCQ